MTEEELRDRIALKILPWCLEFEHTKGKAMNKTLGAAQQAYKIADAMMKARVVKG